MRVWARSSPEAVRRFELEAQAAGQLRGPHVVPLAEAYWIWGYITNLVIAIPTRLALEALPILGFFLWLLGIAYAGFIAAAIWRSADHSRGRPLWATLAKVSVALGMTISVATILAVFGATF